MPQSSSVTFRDEWRRLQDEHKQLADWRLVIDSRTRHRRMGQCRYSKKEIGISAWLVDLNGVSHERVIDTLRHEVAHALVGPGKRHGPEWRRMARALGARPSATCAGRNITFPEPTFRYRAECTKCGRKFARVGKPRKERACSTCYLRRITELTEAGETRPRTSAFEETKLCYRRVSQ